MATLSLQNFTTLVQNMAASVQGACATLLDLTVGSVLRAILEATGSVALWLQWLALTILQTSRLNTSMGTDVDSFVNQFAMYRLAALFASGMATFSRFVAATTAPIIPVGANVKTGDGTQTFIVTADPTNPAYSALLGTSGGYLLAAGATSVSVPVMAAVAGLGGNVMPGTITLMGTAIPGVDAVTNPVAFTNGAAGETDAALIARFPIFIDGLSKATEGAIETAILSVQQGIDYAIAANVDAMGNPQPGNFIVTIDDGTGIPNPTLNANVYSAVDAVRSICESFSVQSPTDTWAAVTFTITAPTAIKPSLIGPVETSVTSYIDSLTIGQTLSITKLAAIIYNTNAAITNVSALLINGMASDLTTGPSGVIRAQSVVAS